MLSPGGTRMIKTHLATFTVEYGTASGKDNVRAMLHYSRDVFGVPQKWRG